MSDSLVIHVDESAVGIGKTENAMQRSLRVPARWLFAVERRDAVVELANRFRASPTKPNDVKIVSIISNQSVRGLSVRQEVEALPDRYANGHVIVICTHEALLMSDLSGFAQWHLVIDEVPRFLITQEIQSKLDHAFFSANYELAPIDEKWSVVLLTDAGRRISGSDLFQDDSHRHLRLFHQRVSRSDARDRPVICNLRHWEEMRQPNVKWVWWSVFSLRQLEPFASVRCLGNGFMSAISTKIMRAWEPEVIWQPHTARSTRPLTSRRVSVRYFSQDRPASKSFFESDKGQAALRAIAQNVAETAPADRLIWSSNDLVKGILSEHLPTSAYATPKQAGTCRWMDRTHAAMIYAAKPNPSIRAILSAIGVDHHAWVESTEYETVLQFVTRTSIREASSGEHATVFVFDRWQAEYLMAYFRTQDHINAESKWIDLGLDFAPVPCGRKPQHVSAEEAGRKAAARRAKKAAYERARRQRVKNAA